MLKWKLEVITDDVGCSLAAVGAGPTSRMRNDF